jgi:hypothetical protein
MRLLLGVTHHIPRRTAGTRLFSRRTEKEQAMGDPVTWVDLGAKDPEPLQAFYGSLFGWDHMQTGAFRDPAGNVFGVYHHGEHA